MSQATRLRELIEADEVLACPGVYDGITARVVDRLDFACAYMTGYGTAASRCGLPDAGLITMPEMVENAKSVAETASVPVIADADTGYGNATNVIRTVREYCNTDVAAIHLEDQTFPKRCGALKGRQLIPREEAVGKFRAAADVRDDRAPELVLIARTDARGAEDGSLNEAIERVTAYCDAGADVAFVEGLADEEELARVGEEAEYPLLYDCAGISPRLSKERLAELGWDVVIYPLFSIQATVAALYEHSAALSEEGIQGYVDIESEFHELPFDLHEFVGFPEVAEWGLEYLPSKESEKYDDTLGADIRD